MSLQRLQKKDFGFNRQTFKQSLLLFFPNAGDGIPDGSGF
jgi:hypothetical protein